MISQNRELHRVVATAIIYNEQDAQYIGRSACYKWITVDDLSNYDLIEGISEEIKMVEKILKDGNPREN